MGKFIDLTGKKFGRLLVLEKYGKNGKHYTWKCLCDCGTICIVRGISLKAGRTKSCGCLRIESCSRRGNRHSLYNVWCNMQHSAGKITICEEWLKFKPFFDWAKAKRYKKGLTIARIDSNGIYEPSNCRWASAGSQYTYNGKTQSLVQWAIELGLNYYKVWDRVKVQGWSLKKAFTTH